MKQETRKYNFYNFQEYYMGSVYGTSFDEAFESYVQTKTLKEVREELRDEKMEIKSKTTISKELRGEK